MAAFAAAPDVGLGLPALGVAVLETVTERSRVDFELENTKCFDRDSRSPWVDARTGEVL